MSGELPADGRYGPAPPDRRRLEVAQRREVGPYVVISAEDPDGAAPAPGNDGRVASATPVRVFLPECHAA